MSNERSINDAEYAFFKEHLEKNSNPNNISKLYLDEFKRKMVYSTVRSKMRALFSKDWDAKDKVYKPCEEEESQTSFIPDDYHNYKNIENNCNNPNDNSSKNLNNDLLDYLKSIDKKLSLLNTRITKLESYIEKNSPAQKRELVNTFIDIFSSHKDRDSVNINSELKRKVIEKMAESKGIIGNQSHAINTALMIALFSEE